MVMEAPPSPQSVGREFVRQYYTLLNKAPTHLHRFYNNQSSFVHGGLDPPNRESNAVIVIGQKQIHQKIQQLNFRDCHAKITQVDAQATLGNGVVVQVTGELSNAGQPMRRFTQTFVLAAQSPKKYYVHNDIFRYQDEIVSDDECEPESRSEAEDDLAQERQVLNEHAPMVQQTIPYYAQNPAPLPTNLQAVPHHHGQPPTTLAHVLPPPQQLPAVNGAVHPDDLSVISSGQVPQHATSVPGQGLGAPLSGLQPGLVPPTPLSATVVEDIQPVIKDAPVEVEDDYGIVQDSDNQDLGQDTGLSPNEPKTYATLLKSGSGSGTGYSVPPSNNNSNVFMPPPKSHSPTMLSQNRFDNNQTSPMGNNSSGLGQRNSINRGLRNTQQPPRMPRQDPRSNSGKIDFNNDGPTFDDRRKSSNQFSSFGDSYQLFLGNLPHSATEDELREIFSQFGPIVFLQIRSKPMAKNSGPRPPNFGFITYDNQQAVQNCLAAKPIYYPMNDTTGTTLNVEEKKTKDRPSYGGGGGGGGNRINSDGGPRPPRDTNGPRRPPGGVIRAGGGGPVGVGGGRPNSFSRPPPNRTPNNTYNNRR